MSFRQVGLMICLAATIVQTCGRAFGGDVAALRQDASPLVGDWSHDRLAVMPVSLRSVRLGGVLGAHVDANNRTSLMAGLSSLIPAAFDARAEGREPPPGCRRLATDSDFYKWLEGACYAVAYDPSLAELESKVARYVNIIRQLQRTDGYVGTGLNPAGPFDENITHDLYIAGHLIEAAVAHYKATGDRALLDVAVRLADFYHRAWTAGHPYYRIVGRLEHPEIELALVRLYRATGERRFLDFSRAMARESKVGATVAELQAGGGARHAVRTCYLLAGIAEHFLETGDTDQYRHLPGLWDEITATRMYVTGGIGYSERIPVEPYDLPQCLPDNPHRDIAETCASVAMMMWSWRMHALTGDSRFFDVIETILYNHYLGAISADHLGNFYYNPLRRVGDLTGQTDHGADPVQRRRLPEIHSTACCLPNSWRFFGQLPEYVFSHRDAAVLVNLYTSATAYHTLPDGTRVRIDMETPYPREGRVRLRMTAGGAGRWTLKLRIPAWCGQASVRVGGGEAVAVTPGGYHAIDRQWPPEDEVVLDLAMGPKVLESRPEVVANRGQVAFRRGPLIYCLEKPDIEDWNLSNVMVMLDRANPEAKVRSVFDTQLQMHTLKVRAGLRNPEGEDLEDLREVNLIPFSYRANRSADSRWLTFIPVRWRPAEPAP